MTSPSAPLAPEPAAAPATGAELDGLVISSVGVEANVELPGVGVVRCRQPRGRAYAIAGDRVAVQWDPQKPAIVRVAARRSVLARHNQREREVQEVAANIDRLLVVLAIQPPPRPRLVDRYLAVAEWQGIARVVVLNKMDLPGAEEVLGQFRHYEQCGCDVVGVSAATGMGMERLAELVATGTSILAGHSGVGKSSVIRALLPGHDISVGAISQSTGKGRHTTTTSVAYRFGEALLIDTPGVREFALAGIDPAMLRECFHDIDLVAPECRFADCLHLDEPGCAVRAAAAEGRIAADRYASYKDLYRELLDAPARITGRTPGR